MKQLLLLAAVGALSLPAMADAPTPEKLEDANAYAMSPNGKYIVSYGMNGTKVIDMASGRITDFSLEPGNETYAPGIATCVSDNGIVVGGTEDAAPRYWKDGEWYDLQVPANSLGLATGHSITPDGFRICGTIRSAGMSMDDDTLMTEPCVWTWDSEKGTFGMPLILPHPDVDFSGRVPQYITALDIADDGKTVIGQVRTATGMIHYPIVYKENDEGVWSYRTLFEDQILPEGLTFPEYPGESSAVYPNYQDYMTPADLKEYNDALDEWYITGFNPDTFPEVTDYMTPENRAAYEKAQAEAEAITAAWLEKYQAWMEVFDECLITWADFQFNSIRISPDGKQFANTMLVPGEPDYEMGIIPESCNVWVFDINGDIVAKYAQDDNYTLTYFANDGIALASTDSSGFPQSFVLANGKATGMNDWITSRIPAYSTWIDDNMTFEVSRFVENPETGNWEEVYTEAIMTGKAYSNADLSIITLGIDNYWDYMDDGITCIFNMNTGSAVSSVSASEGETVIYDLSGRRLKNADGPGIYIVNGEKKVVR